MMADEKGGYIPSDALLKIEHTANVQHEKWEQWLNSMPEIKQYEKLLNLEFSAEKFGVSKAEVVRNGIENEYQKARNI